MNIVISNKTSFVNNFLLPISKLTNSAVVRFETTKITSLISTNDNTIILNITYNNNHTVSETLTLNIPDVNKLIRILSVIEGTDITIEVSKNNISYTSSTVRFKYHLFEDGIIVCPKLNMARLDGLDFDGKFTLPFINIQNLVKGSSIATDSNKIYLTYKENNVLGELTDKARPNVDSYSINISDSYTGIKINSSIPLNFEIFRIISSMRFKELKCEFSSKTGVYIFTANPENTNVKFVISALAN